MDNVTRSFLDSLDPAPLQDRPLGFLFLHVLLYRAPLPRPLRHIWPVTNPDGHNPNSKCTFRHVATFSVHGCLRPNRIGHDIDFFTDQPSLLTPHPLCFHAITVLVQPDLPAYSIVGGGGSACPADDVRTMRMLLSALRSFPSGWHLGMDANDPDADNPLEDDDAP